MNSSQIATLLYFFSNSNTVFTNLEPWQLHDEPLNVLFLVPIPFSADQMR